MPFLSRCLTAALLLLPPLAHAQARFDLTGPKIDVRVTRAGVTLPIAQVPNLQPGDQIWLHPDLPLTQSVHYLLIAAFLRGTTNPPPDSWFTRIETWQKNVREEGVQVTVPAEAQQAILFLAPETGGDFSTLRSAVKGRPGIFVRASQDLTEAGFEQARIDSYLAALKLVPPGDPAALLEHSNLLARTLALRPNPDCFKRTPDQQYTCLTQTGSQTLLDDGHGTSLVASLSQGPGSDFINQASYTQLAGAGTYSAYVGAIVDFARILNSLHTAQFQYIPAIAEPTAESLNLRLNTPPSFHNPKSVLVVGMPAIQPVQLPPLRPASPGHISCLLDPAMVLPIEGAPLVFSTAFAHNLVLHLNTPTLTDLPLTPDAYGGGLKLGPPPSPRHELPTDIPETPPNFARTPKPIDKSPEKPKPEPDPTRPITGTIRGSWGFDVFTGPTLALETVPGTGWHIVNPSLAAPDLIAGQPNHLEIASSGTACIQTITLPPDSGKLDWRLASDPVKAPEPPAKATAANPEKPAEPAPKTTPGTPAVLPTIFSPVELTLNLQATSTPGAMKLAIQQFGQPAPDHLDARTFAAPAHIDSVQLHAGDTSVQLAGHGLDQVKQLTLHGATYLPAPHEPEQSGLTLTLAKGTNPPNLKSEEKLEASINLQDGRTLNVSTVVLPPRPSVTLLSRHVESAPPSAIQLSSPDEVPLGARLVFFLKSKANFPRAGQIEVASDDASLDTRLTLKDSSLVLEDTHTVLATLDPLKLFGSSAFGPFRLRALAPDGTPGDWLPLATIVRLPTLTELDCPANPRSNSAAAAARPAPAAAPLAPSTVNPVIPAAAAGTLPIPQTPEAPKAPSAASPSCLLTGSSLYLIDSISNSLAFTDQTHIPEGFADTTLAIPHPTSPIFYLRLHDDPTEIQQATLPIQQPPTNTARTHPH